MIKTDKTPSARQGNSAQNSASQDNIAVYKAAIEALSGRESDTTLEALGLKHKAVLALARAGSTAFAQGEYDRYGLASVTQHEDIMALSGRLAKDRYLASGDVEQARLSAQKYEAAFQSTGGYYSGINAATMSFTAQVPLEIVLDRARAVLSILEKNNDSPSPQERYFIEATRAEAYCLLGDNDAAKASLHSALDHDPLNYTAHASTYRQLKLLLDLKRTGGEPAPWLAPLRPPLSVHFAGHLFCQVPDEAALSEQLSDIIQRRDIGFGYGALAAGSDIVFAECLLNEGGELHIILPVNEAQFKAKSVVPIGEEWEARYEACRARASSVRVICEHADRNELGWPEPTLNNFAACVAMGEARARARELSSQSAQLLIWDEVKGGSMTAQHALDWSKNTHANDAAREQIIIAPPVARSKKPQAKPVASPYTVKIALSCCQNEQVFDTLIDALSAAEQEMENSANTAKLGLHIAPVGGTLTEAALIDIANTLARGALPGSIIVSQDLAAMIALNAAGDSDKSDGAKSGGAKSEGAGNWETGFVGFIDGIAAHFTRPITK